jgi:glycine cleavage system regulatory protein
VAASLCAGNGILQEARHMHTSLVLTVLGDDRPGIVEQLSDRILAAGANWEESRMARLAGKFAGILRIRVDADRAPALADSLAGLAAGGLAIVVEPSGQPRTAATRALRLELVGNDHPGIIRDISRALAHRQVNIEQLDTDVTGAPMTGDALFRATALLRVPESASADAIVGVLESLAGELMVDLAVDQADESARPKRREPGEP